MAITYLSPGTTDIRQVVFAVNQALERLQNINVNSGGLESNSVIGTTTNDNAPAGYIGEFQSATLVSGSAVSLSNGVAADIITLPLTSGDWDLEGAVNFTSTSTAGVPLGYLISSISTATNTLNETPFSWGVGEYAGFTFSGGNAMPTSQCGPYRASLATSTTFHLVAYAGFSNTLSGYGSLMARRVR